MERKALSSFVTKLEMSQLANKPETAVFNVEGVETEEI